MAGTFQRALRRVRGRVGGASGRRAAGRLTVRPTDVFLVSYPRSGNTWLRFLVANALRPEPAATFADFGEVVPDIYDETDRQLLRRPDPRVLKSHERHDERYRRVLYLVRHPADVAVSYYHYLVKMRNIAPGFELARFVDSFLTGGLDEFGRWGEHVTSWLDAREGDEDFVLLRYEDVLEAPRDALVAALGLIGADVSSSAIDTAVERSSAAELRRLERETAPALPSFQGSRLEDPFIRRARPGGGAEELPPELEARIMAAWPDAAARLGYSSNAR
jgi:hypothetical protein